MAQGVPKNRLKALRDSIQDDIGSEFNNDDNENKVKLSLQQMKAINYHLSGDDMKTSLLKAGYSESTSNRGSDWFANPKFQDYIQERKHEIENRALMSIEDVEGELYEFYRTMKDKEEHQLQLKALELILKYKGMFSPDIIQNNTSNIQVNLNLINPENDDEITDIELE